MRGRQDRGARDHEHDTERPAQGHAYAAGGRRAIAVTEPGNDTRHDAAGASTKTQGAPPLRGADVSDAGASQPMGTARSGTAADCTIDVVVWP